MDFAESLRIEADEKRETWVALRNQITHAQAERERLRGYIEQLNGLLVTHNITPIDISDRPQRGARGFARPGNRDDTGMPPRREEYASVSLPDAIVSILSTGRDLHSNAFVSVIYEVSPEQKELFFKAKRSLVGTLAEGARKGRWAKVSPSTYRLATTVANGHKPNGKVAIAS